MNAAANGPTGAFIPRWLVGNEINAEERLSCIELILCSALTFTFDPNDSPGGSKMGRDFGTHFTDEKNRGSENE